MADVVVNITPPAPITLEYTQGGAVGPQGPEGKVGPPTTITIGQVTTGATATASITTTSPQVLSLVLPPGPQGVAGPFSQIQAGTVTSLSPTSSPSITTSVSGSTVTLNFAIPRGADGFVNLADEIPQPNGKASSGSALKAARADHVHATPQVGWADLTGVPITFSPSTHTHSISQVSGLAAAISALQPVGSYATLVAGKVPSSQLPSYTDDVVEYPSEASLPASGEAGKLYVTVDTNKLWRWTGSDYLPIVADAAASVLSVSGRTGAVVLTSSDVGLSACNNTSDANKPVSTAQASAITAAQNYAVQRSNHTGTQLASTISDFPAEAAKYGPVLSVNGFTGAVTISTGGGGGGTASLSDSTPSALGIASAGSSSLASRSDHVHAFQSYTNLSNIPTSFTPSSHTHDASAVSAGLLSSSRLPYATTTAAGAVSVGSGLAVSGSGSLSVTVASLSAVTSVTAGVSTAATAVQNIVVLSNASYTAIATKSTTTLYFVTG